MALAVAEVPSCVLAPPAALLMCVPNSPGNRDALLDDTVDITFLEPSRHVSSYLVGLAVLRLADSIVTPMRDLLRIMSSQ